MDGPSPLTSWSADPAALLLLVVVAVAYEVRMRRLAARGIAVEGWRKGLFRGGLAVALFAVASPLHAFAEEQFLSAHMLQHLLIGDIVPLMLLGGVTGPILRPLLALPVVLKLRALVHPAIALPVWTLNLYLWHIPWAYEGALDHTALHAIQHVLFIGAGFLIWAPVVEVLPGPEWFGTGMKLIYIVAVRIAGTVLGNVFLWSGSAFYDSYRHDVDRWGISASGDQGIAGGLMMLEGSLVTIGALAWLFLRLAKEGELRQELIEEGLDPRTVARAVRYGRGHELAER